MPPTSPEKPPSGFVSSVSKHLPSALPCTPSIISQGVQGHHVERSARSAQDRPSASQTPRCPRKAPGSYSLVPGDVQKAQTISARVGPHPGRSALGSAPTTSSFAPSATWATPSHKCGPWAPGLGSPVTTPQLEHRQERSAGGWWFVVTDMQRPVGRWPFRVWRI